MFNDLANLNKCIGISISDTDLDFTYRSITLALISGLYLSANLKFHSCERWIPPDYTLCCGAVCLQANWSQPQGTANDQPPATPRWPVAFPVWHLETSPGTNKKQKRTRGKGLKRQERCWRCRSSDPGDEVTAMLCRKWPRPALLTSAQWPLSVAPLFLTKNQYELEVGGQELWVRWEDEARGAEKTENKSKIRMSKGSEWGLFPDLKQTLYSKYFTANQKKKRQLDEGE